MRDPPPGTRIRWPPVTVHATMCRMPNDHNPPGGISARLVSFSADWVDPPGVNDYDSFAGAYAASNENNLVNANYERPAMLALAGDVAGRRILDAGCGSGPLFAALRDRGAIMTGIDKSAGMLELARRRLGDDADLQVAELGSPLPFPPSRSTSRDPGLLALRQVTELHAEVPARPVIIWPCRINDAVAPVQVPGMQRPPARSSCSAPFSSE